MMYITGPLTPDMLQDYKWCDDTNEKVQHVSNWLPLVSTFFEEEDTQQALLIIYCESSGKSNAVGHNKNKTYDMGLWQFNDTTFAWLQGKLINMTGSWNRFDPIFSTKLASWLVYNDGWHHWNSSKHCWGRQYNKTMSVYAKAMAQKAMEQKQNNFKETGIYETNIQRKKRESNLENL